MQKEVQEAPKTKQITIKLEIDLLQKIENEARNRKISKSALIKNILLEFFYQNKEEMNKNVIKIEKSSFQNERKQSLEKYPIIDLDLHRLKKVARELNKNLSTDKREEFEDEYFHLLRKKKQKEKKQNGSE